VALLSILALQNTPYFDFIGYWSSAKIFLNGGNPYSVIELTKVQRDIGMRTPTLEFWNPPWTLFLSIPFSLLEFWRARALWVCIESILLLVSVYWIWTTLGGQKHDWHIACLALVLFIPVFHSLWLAQITTFVLAAILGFVSAIERKREVLAGFFTIFIAAKPHVVYIFWIGLACFCIVNRKIKLFAAVAFFLIVPILLCFLYNNNILWGFESILANQHQFLWLTATPGFSLRMIFGVGHTWLQLLPTILGSLYVIFFWDWKEPFSWRGKLSPMLLLSTSTVFYLWPHDCIILLPVIIQIILRFQWQPKKHAWIVASLIAYDVLYLLLSPGRIPLFAFWSPLAIAVIYILAFRFNKEFGALRKITE
jgi:hypothetical protein